MTKPMDKRIKVLRLMDRIIPEMPDDDTRAFAIALRQRIKLPMSIVLEGLPKNVSALSRDLGIARSTYYAWKKGHTRPRKPEAEALAKATGRYTWEEIAARPVNEG